MNHQGKETITFRNKIVISKVRSVDFLLLGVSAGRRTDWGGNTLWWRHVAEEALAG